MRVVVWNMNQRLAARNWNLLKAGGELATDIALLNEATPPPDGIGLNVETEGETIGRDDKSLGGMKIRKWAAAVVSPHPLQWPDDVWTLSPRQGDRRSKLTVSRPGSWNAAVVSLPSGESITAISVYGLLDERSDASVHRSISDITPLFEDERYNRALLLGGDLNTLCTAKAGSRRLFRDQSVLDRITKGFGLVDLLHESLQRSDPQRGRLAGCRCSFGEDCWHVWTYRQARNPTVPYQDDYLFASPALAERLVACTAREFTPDWPSDHVPITATFKST
jgi:hypothetical protein